MLSRQEFEQAQVRAAAALDAAGIVITPDERANIEVADFGLNDLPHIGLEIVVYVNTDRCCAKELVMFPGQICPEHRHPPIGHGNPGKEETFRVRAGQVYLYLPGEATPNPKASVPAERKPSMTVWHEVVLNPGEQFTLQPNTLHWFQAGPHGAVVSEFSTKSIDEADVFTDPAIQRIPEIVE
jgi:D-lyxose ketol-isomerase